MNDIATITSFIGWCSIINIGLLTFSTIMLIVFREPVKRIHNKLTGVNKESLDAIYFNFLGNYKLAILVLNITPYFALKIMS